MKGEKKRKKKKNPWKTAKSEIWQMKSELCGIELDCIAFQLVFRWN